MSDPFVFYNTIFIYASQVLTFVMVAPIWVAFYYKRYWNVHLRRFAAYILVCFLFAALLQGFIWGTSAYYDTCKPYMDSWKIHNTNFLIILSTIQIFWFLARYTEGIFKNTEWRNVIRKLSIGLLIASLVDYFFVGDFREISTFSTSIAALFTIIVPFLHSWQLFNTYTNVVLYKNSYFWFNLGLIVPALLGLFMDLVGENLYAADRILFLQISILSYVILFLGQLFFCIGFYYARFTKYLPEQW